MVVAVPLAEEKPNAASAACAVGDEAVIEKLAALGVLIVMAPPSIDEGVVVPVIESIAETSVPTVSRGLRESVGGGPAVVLKGVGAVPEAVVLAAPKIAAPSAPPTVTEALDPVAVPVRTT